MLCMYCYLCRPSKGNSFLRLAMISIVMSTARENNDTDPPIVPNGNVEPLAAFSRANGAAVALSLILGVTTAVGAAGAGVVAGCVSTANGDGASDCAGAATTGTSTGTTTT